MAKEPDKYSWEPIGPSGGGQTLAAAISPHNPEIIFCASDMGGIYRSSNAGKTFELLNGHQASRMCSDFNITSVAFHPTKKSRVYIGVWNGLIMSDDNGESFEHTDNFGMPYGPSRIVFDGEDMFFAYNDLNGDFTVVKDQNGKTLCRVPKCSLGLAVKGNNLVLCVEDAVYVSNDCGATLGRALEGEFKGFCQNDGKAYFTSGNSLYIADIGSLEVTRLYSDSFGTLGHTAAVADRIYVGRCGSETQYEGDDISSVLLSTDNGKSFAPILFLHPENPKCNAGESWVLGRWGWHLPPSCLAVSKAAPEMIIYSNSTGLGISTDGGKTFYEAGAANDGSKIQVMTSWDYIIDPNDKNRHYIAMTDFSGWRSADGGKNWEHCWRGNAWKSNIYAIAPHPKEKGRLIAGAANVHDLPYWHVLKRQNSSWGGGLIESFDYGKTWAVQDKIGMGPYGVVTDVKYFKDKVFAAFLGSGAYVSNSDEIYWKPLDRDIKEKNTAKIAVCDDAVYIIVWPQKTEDTVLKGTVYYSQDGEHFAKYPLCEDIKYPVHILPVSQKEIYVSCFDCIDYVIKGRMEYSLESEIFGNSGVYHTTDGGNSWELICDKAAYSTAKYKDALYICTKENGLLVLENNALKQEKSLAVFNPHTVTFDDDGNIYVTSFGQGVYKGTPKKGREAVV